MQNDSQQIALQFPGNNSQLCHSNPCKLFKVTSPFTVWPEKPQTWAAGRIFLPMNKKLMSFYKQGLGGFSYGANKSPVNWIHFDPSSLLQWSPGLPWFSQWHAKTMNQILTLVFYSVENTFFFWQFQKLAHLNWMIHSLHMKLTGSTQR